MNYPQKIKEYREKVLCTQEELAKKLGVSFASVNRWEMGHHEPTMKIKRKLNDLFHEYNVKVEKDYE
mgnify:CR=1 FL=1